MDFDDLEIDDALIESTLETVEKRDAVRQSSKENSIAPVHVRRSRASARKLPGPAGRLPWLTQTDKSQTPSSHDISAGLNSRTTLMPESKFDAGLHAAHTALPQASNSANNELSRDSRLIFGDYFRSWELLQDFIAHQGLRGRVTNVSQISTSRLLGSGSTMGLANSPKVTFMAAMVQMMTHRNEVDAGVTLKDTSGEMAGIIHRRVLETFGAKLGVGTCLLLKDVSIFQPSPRLSYVNVTMRNLMCLVEPSEPPTLVANLSDGQPSLNGTVKVNDGKQVCKSSKQPAAPSSGDFSDLLQGLEQQDLFVDDDFEV